MHGIPQKIYFISNHQISVISAIDEPTPSLLSHRSTHALSPQPQISPHPLSSVTPSPQPQINPRPLSSATDQPTSSLFSPQISLPSQREPLIDRVVQFLPHSGFHAALKPSAMLPQPDQSFVSTLEVKPVTQGASVFQCLGVSMLPCLSVSVSQCLGVSMLPCFGFLGVSDGGFNLPCFRVSVCRCLSVSMFSVSSPVSESLGLSSSRAQSHNCGITTVLQMKV